MKRLFRMLKDNIIEIKMTWYFYALVFVGIVFVILGVLSWVKWKD